MALLQFTLYFVVHGGIQVVLFNVPRVQLRFVLQSFWGTVIDAAATSVRKAFFGQSWISFGVHEPNPRTFDGRAAGGSRVRGKKEE